MYYWQLCCSVYCLRVNVYCTTATECKPNCSWQIYHHIIISYHHIIKCHVTHVAGVTLNSTEVSETRHISSDIKCFMQRSLTYDCGLSNVVGIGTSYGLDGPGIESRWGRDFPHLSKPALGPPSLLYKGYRVFPGGKAAGALRRPSNPSSPDVKETVEL